MVSQKNQALDTCLLLQVSPIKAIIPVFIGTNLKNNLKAYLDDIRSSIL